jgi:hypothetical protein
MPIGNPHRFPASGPHLSFPGGLHLKRHFLAVLGEVTITIIGGHPAECFGRLAAVN